MIAYILKKILSAFLHPVGLCLVLLAVGLILLRRRRHSRLGVWLVSLATVWLLVTSLPITSYFIVRPLEAAAGPRIDPGALKTAGVEHIVVLGGDSPGYPRVAEAVRLWRHVPGVRVILSDNGKPSGADAQRFAVELGVPRDALVAKTGARDTGDEANLFVDTVGNKPFALVTSAYHISRSMKLFQAQGLNPVAAPCEHRSKEFPSLATCLLPSADALLTTQLALHEYLGLAWCALRKI